MHPDVTRIVFAINEGGAVLDLDVRELPQRNLLAVGRGDENAADFFRRAPVLFRQPDHQIELLFTLHHLGRRRAADGGLNQAVDVGDFRP